MKKVTLFLVLLAFAFNVHATTHNIINNDSISALKGDTVVVRQNIKESDFPTLPGVMEVLENGRLVKAGIPEEEGEKVWKFIVKRDITIVKRQGQPVSYYY